MDTWLVKRPPPPSFYGTLNFQCCLHMTVPLDSVQNHLILVYALTTCFLNIYCNIALPSIHMTPKWSLHFMFSILCGFLSSSCMLCGLSVCLHLITFIIFCENSKFQSPLLCIWTQVFSICDLLHLSSQHSSQQRIFKQPQQCSVLKVWVLVSYPCASISIKFGKHAFHTVVYKITTSIL